MHLELNATYAYDAMGNRTSVNRSGYDDDAAQTVYASNRLNQITSSTRTDGMVAPFTSALSYDKSGNLTGETYSSGSSAYTYDDADRLTSLVQKTSAGVNDRKSEFVYDGMSRKVLSHEYSWDAASASWVKQSDVRRIYDGMDVIREVDGLRQTDAQGNIVFGYQTINYTRDGNIGGFRATSSFSTRVASLLPCVACGLTACWDRLFDKRRLKAAQSEKSGTIEVLVRRARQWHP